MKSRYVLQCARHGSESSEWAGKQVVVSRPLNKSERHKGGCPYCKKDVRDAAQGAKK